MAQATPSDFMESAREAAVQCWCDPETSHMVLDPILVEAIAWRIAVWMDTAAQHCRNESFYRDLLNQCAANLGPVQPKVFLQDDGGIVDEPLRVKLPALVKELAIMADKYLESQSAQKEQPSRFSPEYSKWYTETHCGGRHPITVGEMKAMLQDLPDNMPVKVSHQFGRHPVGIHDPIIRRQEISVVVGITTSGAPILGRLPDSKPEHLVIE